MNPIFGSDLGVPAEQAEAEQESGKKKAGWQSQTQEGLCWEAEACRAGAGVPALTVGSTTAHPCLLSK